MSVADGEAGAFRLVGSATHADAGADASSAAGRLTRDSRECKGSPLNPCRWRRSSAPTIFGAGVNLDDGRGI